LRSETKKRKEEIIPTWKMSQLSTIILPVEGLGAVIPFLGLEDCGMKVRRVVEVVASIGTEISKCLLKSPSGFPLLDKSSSINLKVTLRNSLHIRQGGFQLNSLRMQECWEGKCCQQSPRRARLLSGALTSRHTRPSSFVTCASPPKLSKTKNPQDTRLGLSIPSAPAHHFLATFQHFSVYKISNKPVLGL